MNSYNQKRSAAGLSPAVLLVLGVILTAAVMFGIKLLMAGDPNGSTLKASEQGAIFSQEAGAGRPAGQTPAARSESTSGNSLDMFQKANVGYAADESSATTGTGPAGEMTAQKTPAAAAPDKVTASKSAQKTRQRTIIPRMRGVKAFGTAAPGKQGAPKGGAELPDMADMMRQAQQQANGD